MTVMSVGMLNGQLAKLPLNRDDDPAYHGGPEGSDLTPWRREMLPPGGNKFGSQRQIPTGGEIHVAQEDTGYIVDEKFITPEHQGRQYPYEGDVPFNKMRLPVESYHTRAEAFKSVPYWSVKPVIGSEDWPSRKLFPSQPNMEVVDSIEHDILPLPYTQDNNRGYSVMDIPGMDLDLDGQVGIAGLGDFSGLGAATVDQTAAIATQAVVDTAKANPTEAAKPGWLESAISAAASLAAGALALRTAQVQAKVPQYIPGTTTPIPPGVTLTPGGTYVPTLIEEPFYTKPGFLALAALGVLGGGYLLLKK